MTNPTQALSKRDRRTLELARDWANQAADPPKYGDDQEAALMAHLAAPQPPSSPATEPVLFDWLPHDDDLRFIRRVLDCAPTATDSDVLVAKAMIDKMRTALRPPSIEQREGKPTLHAVLLAEVRSALLTSQLRDCLQEDLLQRLRTALAAPSPAVDERVEKDAARYRWLRERRMEFGEQRTDKNWWLIDYTPDEADAAIDAALAAMKETR